MEEVKKVALDKALKTLDAIGCTYCVVDPDQVKYGTLEVVQKVQRGRSKNKYLHGTIVGYLRPLIGGLNPGDVGNVSCAMFGRILTGKYVSAFAVKNFGKGNSTLTYVPEKDEIQLLRVA